MSADLPVDDLGHPVPEAGGCRRVVSLVPSITESLAATCPDRLVGATDWCTHPAGLAVARVRGTKNPDLQAVAALAPDLVVLNEEENRRVDAERLRAAGVPVWVTRTESVPEALASLRRLLTVAVGVPAPPWLAEAELLWTGPVPVPTRRVVVPVWRDPWIAVGSRTFAGDLLARLGCANLLDGSPERYPHVPVADLDGLGADEVLLPSEPYAFSAEDGPEAFVRTPARLVDGRLLTWYGPSLLFARDLLS